MNNWKNINDEKPKDNTLFVAYCETPGTEGALLCDTLDVKGGITRAYHSDNGLFPCIANPTHWHPFTGPTKSKQP
jgi:hypothetical protein